MVRLPASLVIAVLASAVLPGSASAATVAYGLTGARPGTEANRYTRLVFSARPGEVNRVTASYTAAGGYRVSDSAGGLAIAGRAGDPWSASCSVAEARLVSCSRAKQSAGAVPSPTAAGETVRTGDRDDSFRGTGAPWVVDGGDGNDMLSGGLSALGGPGNDRIRGFSSGEGGPGADLLTGTPGTDELVGGVGDDTLNGSGGADQLIGGAGGDRLVGGPGTERLISAGSGNDTVYAADGRREIVSCGPGRDVVTADRADRVLACEVVRRLRPLRDDR